MNSISLSSGEIVPMEMHKAKVIKKISMLPAEQRKEKILEAGCNTFLLKNKDVFLDMLTDSGVNAMSDRQQAAMLQADDSYAGSETFFRLQETTQKIFNKKFLVPAHQGRACEHIISKTLVKPGKNVVLMNFHFTTAKAHILNQGGVIEELIIDEALKTQSDFNFKGNMDLDKFKSSIKRNGADKIAFVRMEAGTNLIGGQPFSLENIKAIAEICRINNIILVLDASLLTDNLFFMKTKEKICADKSIEEITKVVADCADIIYFSARKLGSAKGGVILLNDEESCKKLRELTVMFEGFITYGGMSLMEMEAINVGLQEAMEFDMISQGPQFIEFIVKELEKNGVPMVTPSGGLGAHIDAKKFLSHLSQSQYIAASLAVAVFTASGIRGMERGTLAESKNPDGSEHFAALELLRLAVPRRVFSLSHMKYVVDRITWLYENRKLIGGLKFVEEPAALRFFLGKLAPDSDWMEKLTKKFKNDFGENS
jgi:tryptophanase